MDLGGKWRREPVLESQTTSKSLAGTLIFTDIKDALFSRKKSAHLRQRMPGNQQ